MPDDSIFEFSFTSFSTCIEKNGEKKQGELVISHSQFLWHFIFLTIEIFFRDLFSLLALFAYMITFLNSEKPSTSILKVIYLKIIDSSIYSDSCIIIIYQLLLFISSLLQDWESSSPPPSPPPQHIITELTDSFIFLAKFATHRLPVVLCMEVKRFNWILLKRHRG
jgi:hypothetical protein